MAGRCKLARVAAAARWEGAGWARGFPGTQQQHKADRRYLQSAVYRGTSLPAVTFCRTMQGTRRVLVEVAAAQTLRKETLLQKPKGLLLTKAGGLLISQWEIMVLITSSLLLIELRD